MLRLGSRRALLHGAAIGIRPIFGGTTDVLIASRSFCSASAGISSGQQTLPSWDLLCSSWQMVGFAARSLSSTSNEKPREYKSSTEGQEDRKVSKALMVDQEEFDAITDKIPQKPMSAAEGVSYTAVILAAFGVLAAIVWAFISNYILDPVEYTCFNLTLEKLRDDPRITVRVGDSIKGYGEDSSHRWQRQRIPHREYTDRKGTNHLQIQFHIKGPGGVGVVYADMYQENGKKDWQYAYLYVDFPQSGGRLQRLAIIRPQV